jgi:hypothetical protein
MPETGREEGMEINTVVDEDMMLKNQPSLPVIIF